MTKKSITGAIGPFDNYCDGYGNPGTSGLHYVSVFKLEIGESIKDMDPVLEDIVAYDRAETRGTYFGQVNMITVSSFNGLNGSIWGYDIAKADTIAKAKMKPIITIKDANHDQIPIYSMDPLFDAGKRLFGTNQQRRFCMIPGAHVGTACKSYAAIGPTYVWGVLAVAIAKDRTKDADLFIEDAGEIKKFKNDHELEHHKSSFVKNTAKSIIRCGEDSNVAFKEIFIGHKIQPIAKNHIGKSLAAAPYVVLAKNAIPNKRKPDDLFKMTVSQWEKSLRLKPLA
jgi:histidine decarboxylase